MFTRRGFPTLPFSELRRDVDQAFSDLFGAGDGRSLRQVPAFPAVNLWEDGERLYAEAEVPGVSLNDLEIFAIGNELTVKGRRMGLEGEKLTYHRQERGTGEFSRVIELSAEVDTNRVEAKFKDGVLTIVMPKAEVARARKIQVKAQ